MAGAAENFSNIRHPLNLLRLLDFVAVKKKRNHKHSDTHRGKARTLKKGTDEKHTNRKEQERTTRNSSLCVVSMIKCS